MATLDEASRCPKCGERGDKGAPQPGALPRTTVITFTCRNDACVWVGTGWGVQINPDGSIPERRRGPKQFEPLTGFQKGMAQRQLEEIQNAERGR